jgi:hypothetical protein
MAFVPFPGHRFLKGIWRFRILMGCDRVMEGVNGRDSGGGYNGKVHGDGCGFGS